MHNSYGYLPRNGWQREFDDFNDNLKVIEENTENAQELTQIQDKQHHFLAASLVLEL